MFQPITNNLHQCMGPTSQNRKRGREKMAIIGAPTLLGEMQLPFYLRRDERFFGELGSCWSNEIAPSSPIAVLWG